MSARQTSGQHIGIFKGRRKVVQGGEMADIKSHKDQRIIQVLHET